MSVPRTVLVATDFSPASRAALRQASRLCEAWGASLHVVHVVPGERERELKLLSPGVWDDIESHLLSRSDEQLAEEVERAGVAVSSVNSALGSAIGGILRVASEVGAELLVIGSQGSGERRFGTIAARCMHKSPVSVLMVPPEHEGAFKRIVVGLDFSEKSREVLASAVRVARLDGAAVDSVNVYELPPEPGLWGSPPINAADAERALSELLVSRYEALVPPEAEGLELSFTLVSGFDYGKAIVGFAESKQADLVVIGMTGRSALGYFLLGSTAEKTMRDTSCAVLAVK